MQKKPNPPVTDNRLWLNPAELIFSFASQTLIQITALQGPQEVLIGEVFGSQEVCLRLLRGRELSQYRILTGGME